MEKLIHSPEGKLVTTTKPSLSTVGTRVRRIKRDGIHLFTYDGMNYDEGVINDPDRCDRGGPGAGYSHVLLPNGRCFHARTKWIEVIDD